MTSSSSRPGEFALIAELFAPLATARHAFGLKDDAATLPVRDGQQIVVTTDTIVAGVHFLDSDPPGTIAQKALRVNLSDLAAKGAKPFGYLLALSLPSAIGMTWLRTFAKGLADDQAHFAISLLGGDTTATPGPLAITITAFGQLPKGTMLRRGGAKPGDVVFVSGTIGDAGGGLAVQRGEGKGWSRAVCDHLQHRYRVPQPRTGLGPLLRGVASAALDVSDGLLADLEHIAETSRVQIVVEGQSVPRAAALRAFWGESDEAVLRAVTSGDDYEIAFTVPPSREKKVMAAAARSGVPVSRIGHVERGRGVILRNPAGKPIPAPAKGWVHF
ncbi:MAG TPA: thiamine-phosphate kinase [Rhizomicrobium sp.]|jgi:thiamine-monophosphate kinase